MPAPQVDASIHATRAAAGSWDGFPLGNGDLGVVAWAEDGCIGLLLATGDAWDGLGRLPKVGRLHLRLPGAVRHQHFTPADGTLTIEADGWSARVWVDAHAKLVHVEGTSATAVEASIDPWRSQPRRLNPNEMHHVDHHLVDPVTGPQQVVDELLDAPTAIAWWRCNRTSIWRQVLQGQGLGEWAETQQDPLLHRACGGIAWGDGFSGSGRILRHAAGTWHLQIAVHTTVTSSAATFSNQLALARAAAATRDAQRVREAHVQWWTAFWQRSGIRTGDAAVDQGYARHRYLLACCGRGEFAIKFNGALFTTDWPDTTVVAEWFTDPRPCDADYRRWGGGYWMQNTRLPYWPMLGAGDFDQVGGFLRMYRAALPLAEERTRRWWKHGGAIFPETMYFWGSYFDRDYNHDKADRSKLPMNHVASPWIRWHWSGILELAVFGLEAVLATGDLALLHRDVLPVTRAALRFFREHYDLGLDGRLLISPAQSLETFWQGVQDPLPEIAGLHDVLQHLLALPADAGITDTERADWQALLAVVPDVPVADGRLQPARHFLDKMSNCEHPELYAVFPFRMAAVGGDPALLAAGRAAFPLRRHAGPNGWRQCPIQAAWLGLADEAWKLTRERYTNLHGDLIWLASGTLFPWAGPNFDWLPDLDHQSVAQMSLQSMLLQHDGQRLHICPAWPMSQDVDFRLHAAGAVVEGQVRGGVITATIVSGRQWPLVMPG